MQILPKDHIASTITMIDVAHRRQRGHAMRVPELMPKFEIRMAKIYRTKEC